MAACTGCSSGWLVRLCRRHIKQSASCNLNSAPPETIGVGTATASACLSRHRLIARARGFGQIINSNLGSRRWQHQRRPPRRAIVRSSASGASGSLSSVRHFVRAATRRRAQDSVLHNRMHAGAGEGWHRFCTSGRFAALQRADGSGA